ncbi:MAG: BMP family ABC transporter substrate-binding protein, partial [Alicyclobacillus mali]
MQKRIWQSGLSILAAAALVAGCGTNNSSSGTTNTSNSGGTGNTTSTSGKTIKVGLVTDTGGLNDNSFNHLAYVGMQEAQKDLPNIQTSVVQSQSESDYVPNLSHFAQDGYNLVIAVGYLMADAVQQVAREYPKTHFLIIDDSITGIPNVASAIFQSQQAGYLAGV